MNGSFLQRRRPRSRLPRSSRRLPGCSAPSSARLPKEKGVMGMELRAGLGREERAGEGSARGAKCAPRGPLFLCDSRWLGTDKEIVD